jgi:hypothetical protein
MTRRTLHPEPPPPHAPDESTPLEPERSVPVTGFSRELRGAPDVERYRFAFALRGDSLSPMHVVYSPSQRVAEVKTGDMKAFRVTDVGSAEEARARFVAWWRSAPVPRKPGFDAPRRTGRVPVLVLARP